MNKKGITLIESLAVTCLLAILLLILFPAITSVTTTGESLSETTKEEKLDECMKEFNNFEYCKYKVEELGG